uniref:histidine kinase n=1 Tax=Desulfobacca acetoxidans TaxID=60893 RepID=A0A7C3V6V6_9BACT
MDPLNSKGRLAWGLSAIWTLLVAASLLWNCHQARQTALELASTEAQLSHNKDLGYRLWAARHGGVYVPVTPETQPNPYLSHVPERDLQTPSGRRLTLLNPAYMMRQVHELAAKIYGIKGHITSLKPLRPENAPDAWETQALKAFEAGAPEILKVVDSPNGPHLRYMRPLFTEKDCLKCHAAQGYKEGDIRGGISVDVPLQPFLLGFRTQTFTLAAGHGLIWLMGLAGIVLGNRRIQRYLGERQQAEEALRLSNQRLDLLAETASRLLAAESPQQVVDSLCRKVMKYLDCDAFFNFLVVDDQEGLLRLNTFAGIPEEEAQKFELLRYGRTLCGCAAQARAPIVAEDIQNSDDPRTALVKPHGIQAYACHPLMVEGRILGTLSFGSRKKTSFSADELALMKSVSDQVAIAMARKLAEEALKKAYDDLELRIIERTADLQTTVRQLQWEIAERLRMEEALRQSEERLRFLASQLLNAQETERGRLSRELHDDLGQSLLVLRMQLNAILRRHSLDQEPRRHLEEAVNYLLDIIGKVRRLSQDLSPAALERLGLTEALRDLFENFQRYSDKEMTIKAELDEVKDILPEEANIVIYRITQEFLANVHKHSEATQVTAALKVLPEKVTISLEDNGKGFDLEEIKSRPQERRGLGLTSMEERLRMLGSKFSMTSRPGQGTRLYFEINRIL